MASYIPARTANYITTLVTGNLGMSQFATMRDAVKAFNATFGTKFFLTKSPRLGENNPKAAKYKARGIGGYQMIKIADSFTFDVYLRDRTVYNWNDRAMRDELTAKFNELKTQLTRA